MVHPKKWVPVTTAWCILRSGSLSPQHGASSEVGPYHHSMVHPQKWVPITTAWCILRSGSLAPQHGASSEVGPWHHSMVHPQKCLWSLDGYWKHNKTQITGTDQIAAELIKVGGRTACCEIHELIKSIWNKEELTENWKESIIVSIYRKGDKTECSNYRSISLLLTMHKMLSNILLSGWTPYAEEIIGDHQCGFRCNRSSTGHILCVRQKLEKNGNTRKQCINCL